MTASKGTESAGRTADVLLLYAAGPESLGVSEIARALKISKTVVYRILQALVEKGLLQAETKSRRYRLGPGLAGLGARALRDSDLRRNSMPILRRLQHDTRETVTVSALIRESRIYLDQIESPREIKMVVELGQPYPLYAGSSGTCILAHLPTDVQERVLSDELIPLTSKTVVSVDELREKLSRIRELGYAWSGGERQAGAGSVAAPVFGLDGSVIGSISVCGPVGRMDQTTRQRLGPMLIESCAEVSASLGWTA